MHALLLLDIGEQYYTINTIKNVSIIIISISLVG